MGEALNCSAKYAVTIKDILRNVCIFLLGLFSAMQASGCALQDPEYLSDLPDPVALSGSEICRAE